MKRLLAALLLAALVASGCGAKTVSPSARAKQALIQDWQTSGWQNITIEQVTHSGGRYWIGEGIADGHTRLCGAVDFNNDSYTSWYDTTDQSCPSAP